MSVNNAKSLILIGIFVVKTCVRCINIPFIFPAPLYVPASVGQGINRVPIFCNVCTEQMVAGPVPRSVSAVHTPVNYAPVLRRLTPRLLQVPNVIGRRVMNVAQPLHISNLVLPVPNLHHQIEKQLKEIYLRGPIQHVPNVTQTEVQSFKPIVKKKIPVTVVRKDRLHMKYGFTTAISGEFSVTSTPEHVSVTTSRETKTDRTISKPPENITTIRIQTKTSTTIELPDTTITEEKSGNFPTTEKVHLESDNKTFNIALEQFDRKFYSTTFLKLTSISTTERRENGISFVESGLFLYLILIALSTHVDNATKAEIDKQLAPPPSDADKISEIRDLLDTLPVSSDVLKFRWSSRLVVNGSHHNHFETSATRALRMKIDSFDPAESPTNLVNRLNRMVETDSGGAMRDTFEEDELAGGARAVLLSTVYVRARWRASPTLLNDSQPFYDHNTPPRLTRMIRINDNMRHAHLPEWDAEAVEISYSTPGLSLLLLVPRGRSLRPLTERSSGVSLESVTSRLQSRRVAATLPIYTLRMTLLLPNKLEAMNMSRLLCTKDTSDPKRLHLSHAVQRVMFWAEAGRNAYKDDGIEWDEPPEIEVMVNRPYIFFVRWQNLTLMHGNFVH